MPMTRRAVPAEPRAPGPAPQEHRMTPKQLVQKIKHDNIEFVDLRFMDF